jgi:hypothetical protein
VTAAEASRIQVERERQEKPRRTGPLEQEFDQRQQPPLLSTLMSPATARAIFTSPPPIITLPHVIINAMGEQEQAKQHAAAAREHSEQAHKHSTSAHTHSQR